MDIVPLQIGMQLVIFLGVLVMLNVLVFQPLLKRHQLRQRETEGREKEAREILERGQVLVQRYDQSLAEARSEAHRKVQAAAAEAAAVSKEMIGEARDKAQELFGQRKQALAKQREQALEQSGKEVEKLSSELADAVLH